MTNFIATVPWYIEHGELLYPYFLFMYLVSIQKRVVEHAGIKIKCRIRIVSRFFGKLCQSTLINSTIVIKKTNGNLLDIPCMSNGPPPTSVDEVY